MLFKETSLYRHMVHDCGDEKLYILAEKHSNKNVISEYSNCPADEDEPDTFGHKYRRWEGKGRFVYYWLLLEDGTGIGFNENPARGWSFPTVKVKGDIKC